MSRNTSSKNSYTGRSHSYNSVFKPIVAGKFRELITIETPEITVPDGGGGGIYGWSRVARVWAALNTFEPGNQNQKNFQEGQMRANRQFHFTLRYGNESYNLTTAMRVLYRTFILQVYAVVNVDYLNWTVELYCENMGKT